MQVELPTPDGPMPTYVAEPDAEVEARGAIVVVQEAFGVTTHIEDVARRLARARWLAIAPALFHRAGSPVLAYDDFDAVLPVMQQLTAEGITHDVSAAFDYLEVRGFPARRTGVVGFCMGGAVALYAATLRPLGAAVTFYGGGVAKGRFRLPSLIDLAPTLRAPWLGLYADRDRGIPVADVEALREAAMHAGVATDIVRYANAEHGYHCEDRPQAYDQAAATDSWQRTLAWFDMHIIQT